MLLGELRFVQVTLTQPARAFDPADLPWRVMPETAGGGLFVDLAAHTLDFLDYVLGPITKVHGIARNQGGAYPAEDIVGGVFEFENGLVGNGLWSFTSFEATDRVVISGDKGKVTFATFENEPVVLETGTGRQSFTIPQPPHVQQPLIQQVVDEILGRGHCVSTGENGLRTTQVMETLLSDYYRK